MRPVRGAGLTALLLAFGALAPASLPAQRLECDRCHAELELLRQQVFSLTRAEQLLAPAAVLRTSAHGKLACRECHSGIDRYPHVQPVEARTCASCHPAADSAWRRSVHANVRDRDPTGCTDCHGVHDVAGRQQLRTGAGIQRANARCSSCHQGQQLQGRDAHAGRALCAACHGAHDVRQPEHAASTMHPVRQLATCGACHDSVAARWRHDVHADTLRQLLAAGALDQDPDGLPGCTGCHGVHGDAGAAGGDIAVAAVDRCAACHEHYAESYYESYHGQAVRLGSTAAAACADCHGAHGIRPSREPAARTAAGNLVSTCSACHERVSAGFVGYDSHPEPMNRARNPWIFFAFWSMNALLIGAIGMWGLHTALWWIRLRQERRKASDTSHAIE
jgi:hypothetical protein